MTTSKTPNRLIHEKSPYLLQHAYNPVDWWPWCEKAFMKAKTEDKPIFLSIGYSTCHWCHVMAHESFEDTEVAEYLNQYFISIKVDKEERPDVDSIYMSVCQRVTGSGGWPLTIIMMPDQKPFFAGTYFPKRSRYNMPGFLDLLKAVIEKWRTEQDSLKNSSLAITQSLQQESIQGKDNRVSKQMVEQAARSLLSNYDSQYGGFGGAPKFPTPHNLMFLLRFALQENKEEALEAVEKTLDAMYIGGIFDHIGYGFSRYSTDEKWLVPHFEKMLYDNALLIHTYLEAHQYTKKEHYKEIAQMTLEYVQRELTHEEGGFYCAQDADSEGVEGKYYVFRPEEVISILGKEDGTYFNDYFDITAKGNFEEKNIPNRIKAYKNEAIEKWNKEAVLEPPRISSLREKMYAYRLNRTKLHKDDKILTSWNGIMIGACAKAYKILKQEAYLNMAQKADEFIQKYLSDGEKLYVHYREGKASGLGHIDDYAFYGWALLELYEATLEINYIKRALEIMNQLVQNFFDTNRGGFYLYSKDAEMLIHRPKEWYDGAIPSGNSVVTYVLEKLYHITGNQSLREILDKQLSVLAAETSDYPSAYCFSMMAVMQEVYPTKELVCVLPKEYSMEDIKNMLSENFLPQVSIVLKSDESKVSLEDVAEFTKDYPAAPEKPAYYLCENHSCQAPVYELNEIVYNMK
ncbi:thioredoxin domain-containing protein [Anaerocolumna cellulosilytica]|uniref:Thioredoxin domain-containing protein n=1 Tax=Anaerocolumna cellulosilytica TaxID=433286 RepID=A0A6S6R2E5_9FIRM|nr:thioredoxin domain-containing protein [Anaerocolumna cellulosilytica]MBB5196013.1 hypothetical protein [Anaerocolumna cellulosilytica]BCJ93685.1 thioredoxin domain-containing protein [Anaerocolumna cellulosilytica]